MIALQINITDHASPRLQQLINGLTDRTALNLTVGKTAQNCIRDHLIALAATRHATANRLGATPSGHLAKAAEKVALPSSLTDHGDSIEISLNHPGLARAFQDIDILPGAGKKYLTLPATAQSYNKRATRFNTLQVLYGKNGPYALAERAFTDLRWRNTTLKTAAGGRQKQKTAAAGAQHGGKIFYWLVKSVHQTQDRTLLPADSAITEAALGGVRDYVTLLIQSQTPSIAPPLQAP